MRSHGMSWPQETGDPMGRIRVIVALGALALAVAELGSASTVAAASPGSARAVAGLKGWPESTLAAALSVSGPVTLGYSATTSETDSCTGDCAASLAIGNYSSYNETATGSLRSKVNFIVNSDGTTTPGSARLNEPSDTWNASATIKAGTVLGCVPVGSLFSGSATEVAQGGTLPGKLRVDSLKVITGSTGQTDLALESDIPRYPEEKTSATYNGTLQGGEPCNITQPGKESGALDDVYSVSGQLGLINDDGNFLVTGWKINPDWKPENGGTLATKTLTGSAPQVSIGPEVNTGAMNATQTWTLTTSCVGAKVNFPPIRAKDTPPDMPDRIPPRVGTKITLTLSKPILACQKVSLSVQGGSNDGSVLINGGNSYMLPANTTPVRVTLTGQNMTAIGDGAQLMLTATDESKPSAPVVIAQSQPFAVSAIPVNFMDTCIHPCLAQYSGRLGIVVGDSWQSDSGQIADLSGIQMAEVVQTTLGPVAKTSGFRAATKFSEDVHTMPLKLIPSSPGVLVFSTANQAHGFIDERATSATPTNFTAADFFPISNSGYTIERSVGQDSFGNPTLTTSKTGANVTATATIPGTSVTVTIATTAGQTTPAAGISETEPIP